MSAAEKSSQKVVCTLYPFSAINALNVISLKFLVVFISLWYILYRKVDYFSAHKIGGLSGKEDAIFQQQA